MAFGAPHGELLQVSPSEMSWSQCGERVPAVLVEGGSVRGQLVLGEEGGGVMAVVSDICVGGRRARGMGRRANLLSSLLYIPLYRNVLYTAETRCVFGATH
jgi:hypothetical protein